MTVYGDLLFLINFSMDFLCFYLSCILIREKIKALRFCIASAVGGAYSVAALFIELEGVWAFILDIAVLVIMCAIAYLTTGMGMVAFIKRILLYFIVSALLGGFMTATFSMLNRIEMFGKEIGISEGIDVWLFALLAIISTVLTLKGGTIFRASSRKNATVEIVEGAKRIKLSALIDSGNLAYEPISGRSVIFARLEVCRELFCARDYLALKNGDGIEQMPISLAMRVRPILSKTVSGRALLPAIRFKNVSVILGKRRKQLDTYIAFLNDENISGYDAIISNELIT